MKKKIAQQWIEAGYEIFAKEGPNGLKVEQIARKVGKSKSSFYHLFADTELFQEKLLEWHLERAVKIAERTELCKSLVPDQILLMIDLECDVLFNRQLRINRNNPAFQHCFEQANRKVEAAMMGIWADFFGLSGQPVVAQSIMKITTDNFYLRITEENLNYEWMLTFLYEIKNIIKHIVKSGEAESPIE